MSLFKKKKKTEVVTFSVEDARAMAEGKYNETLAKVRLDFWTNVKKNAMEGKTSYKNHEYLYDSTCCSHGLGKDAVKIYETIAAEFESFGFKVLFNKRVTKREDCDNTRDYLMMRDCDRVDLKICWDKEE
jgi:hypothetical protein